MCKKYCRRQEDFLVDLWEKYDNEPEVNMFPDPMTDTEFRKLIVEYLLGDFYVIDPLTQAQANVYLAEKIIKTFKVKKV